MKIFSKKKYDADTSLLFHHEWAEKANGKEAKYGYIVGTGFLCCGSAVDNWCVDTAPLMERFKNEKIAVRFNASWQLDIFLKMCEEAGLMWRFNEKATSYKPPKVDTCIAFGACSDRLGYCNGEYYSANNWEVMDYLEFIDLALENDAQAQQPEAPRYKITITCEGTTTTAAFEVDGKTVKTATAKCNPVDKFNFHTGAELAFDRLFEKQHKALDLRNLKVGDKVRVRKDLKDNDEMSDGTLFTYDMARFCGKVVTISEKEFGKYHIAEDKRRWYFTEEMFENI